VICAEENPNRCHRHFLISRALLDRGIEVQHIRGEGTLESATRESEQLELPWLEPRGLAGKKMVDGSTGARSGFGRRGTYLD